MKHFPTNTQLNQMSIECYHLANACLSATRIQFAILKWDRNAVTSTIYRVVFNVGITMVDLYNQCSFILRANFHLGGNVLG